MVDAFIYFGFGIAIALSPGHGKTIMAAYLVGTRGSAIHALFLGLTVTVSHTLGVLGLGLLTLYASHLITPERLYPWLALVSGGTVIAIGLWLLLGRMRGGQPADPSNHYPAPGYLSGHTKAKGHSPRLAGIRKMLKKLVASKAMHGHNHQHDSHRPHQHSQDHRTKAGGNLNLT
jgi:ABC-type nickel/cobalt efflux system permease component RcnA